MYGGAPSKANIDGVKKHLLEEMGIGAEVSISKDNSSMLIAVKTHHSAMKICTALRGDFDFSIHHKREYSNSFIVQVYDTFASSGDGAKPEPC
jgi:hypothetical protein